MKKIKRISPNTIIYIKTDETTFVAKHELDQIEFFIQSIRYKPSLSGISNYLHTLLSPDSKQNIYGIEGE